jgi:XTP/dITP diphosphohydrolase
LKAVLASRNAHKAQELERLLPGWEIDVLEDHGYPAETGATYYDNARSKALFGRSRAPADRWVLGEDSGIEVVGLGGSPGVTSSRTAAGDEVGWMLLALEGVEGDGRRARYVCELVAIAPDGRELRGTGTLSGRIATGASGAQGFGFDPVFVPEGEHQTVAELGDEWKARHSHRAQAAHALLLRVSQKDSANPSTKAGS